ncbi:MAG: M20/M25/M40 family metallo-hydrolase [Bacteroidales bacterium]|nr:M20/M25/M40 family metallo-hydrolase [Bacteroidales bacterium]
MNLTKPILSFAGLMIILTGLLNAQNPIESITQAEIRDHIFFLASDYMNGRVGPSAEYEIAAQYVATQFAGAGLKPAIKNEEGYMNYFQGVPFIKTTYSDDISWTLIKEGKEIPLEHKEDFRFLTGNKLIYNKMELVWVGYGIEEPDYKWNDFEKLDVRGKIMVCIFGAPTKDGEPVLPEEVHKKYQGLRGFQSKASALFNKGAEGLILADLDGSTGMPFEMIPSEFSTEKYIYKGSDNNNRSESIPLIYFVKPEFIELLMEGNKYNPMMNPENILKNYKPHEIEGVYMDSKVEILSEELITTKNVVGMVEGTDPELRNEFIVVGAHLDHVKPVNGQVCNGADDNASGSAGVIEIAEAVAMNPCKRSVVFITYTAEEMGLIGSRHFVGSNALPVDQIKFNLNMDMIGRSDPDNRDNRAHYVVTDKKYVDKLKEFITGLNDGVTDFPLIFDNDEDSPGGSDHQSYINKGIPAFFFFSGIHEDLHQPGDDPGKIDYAKAESICRLAYLITTKLANMDAVPTFLIEE